jgi:predicted transcriptional regulator
MLTPQEIEVWYLLPALRREIAMRLKSEGYSQKDIAKLMDITPAAISQYLHNKRAKKLDIEIEHSIIDNAVKEIQKAPKQYSKILQESLKKMEKLVCEVHKKIEKVHSCCGLCEKNE